MDVLLNPGMKRKGLRSLPPTSLAEWDSTLIKNEDLRYAGSASNASMHSSCSERIVLVRRSSPFYKLNR